MCELHPSSISESVHAVQQLAVAARPTRGGQERVPRYLLGMRGRADGRVESLRGTWRSFNLLRGMGGPTGRSVPGKKTSCGTGRPGGVQRNPCAKPSKMNGICLGLACSGTRGPPEASGVPEPARRVPQNRAAHNQPPTGSYRRASTSIRPVLPWGSPGFSTDQPF